jgi:hypothetical protein
MQTVKEREMPKSLTIEEAETGLVNPPATPQPVIPQRSVPTITIRFQTQAQYDRAVALAKQKRWTVAVWALDTLEYIVRS